MVLKNFKSVLGLLIVFLLSLGINLALSTQPVYAVGEDISASFTDPNFKQAVWEWLGNSGEPEGFTQQDLINQSATKDILVVNNKGIVSLAGLENFNGTDLRTLNCSGNQLTNIPELPNNLTSLLCYSNQITGLPTLPSNLAILSCSYNRLTSLPMLPVSLTHLSCGNNRLTDLPDLPSSLGLLYCDGNYLNVFSGDLKNKIDALNLDYKDVTPQFRFVHNGGTLTVAQGGTKQIGNSAFIKQSSENGSDWTNTEALIDIKDFQYSSSNETFAGVDSNGLITAYGLGSCNIYADFAGQNTEYTRVVIPVQVDPDISASFTDPNFKQAVWEWLGNTGNSGPFTKQELIDQLATEDILDVSNKNIVSLAGLENFDGTDLHTLNCNDNQITSLPELPGNLTSLVCYNNRLTNLPDLLPSNLTILSCSYNRLTSLPGLPSGLQHLSCNNNYLNVFSGDLKDRIDALTLQTKSLVPQFKFVYMGESLTVTPDSSKQISSSDFQKQSSLNITDWMNTGDTVSLEECIYSSSNIDIADVDSNGLITAKELGNCDIYVDFFEQNTEYTRAVIPLTVDPDISASFTDPNFKQAVWEWLGNSGTPGSFTKQDLKDKMYYWSYTLNIKNKNITNLAGLENFNETGLKTLDCSYNQLTALPEFPAGLLNLDASWNQLTSLPKLPDSLDGLAIQHNQLTSLPDNLPSNLTALSCGLNQFTSLPDTLPDSLVSLNCQYNQLTVLPAKLPSSLEFLNVQMGQLTVLPESLPSQLSGLYTRCNKLTELPVLPDSLTELDCVSNQLTSLPVLPANLEKLQCGGNQLTILPDLPGNLTDLSCDGSGLTALPNLPSGLLTLVCGNNRLASLPTLPSGLEYLSCESNYLNVFNGQLKNEIDALSLETKVIVPQYRFSYPAGLLTLGPDGSKQLSGSDFKKQSSDNGTNWTNLNVIIGLNDFDFSSSDTNIADVDSNGLITAKGPGNCDIYADFSGQNFEYTRVIIPVTVNPTGSNLEVRMNSIPDQCAAGTKFDIEVEVANIGTSISSKAVVNFYINNQKCLTKTVSKLKYGSKAKVIKGKITVPRTLAKGLATFKVELITDTDVNQGNNIVQKSITIVLPDLTVTSVVPKKELVGGKSGTMNVGIANLTVAPAGKFVVRVYRENEVIGEKTVSSLKQGSKSLSIKIKVPVEYDPINDVLTVVVDAVGQVAEENEDNNQMDYQIIQ